SSYIQQHHPALHVSGQITGLHHKASITAREANDHNPYQVVLQTIALHAAHDMSYRSRTKKRSTTNDAQAPKLTAQQRSWSFLPRAAAALSWFLRLLQPKAICSRRRHRLVIFG